MGLRQVAWVVQWMEDILHHLESAMHSESYVHSTFDGGRVPTFTVLLSTTVCD